MLLKAHTFKMKLLPNYHSGNYEVLGSFNATATDSWICLKESLGSICSQVTIEEDKQLGNIAFAINMGVIKRNIDLC